MPAKEISPEALKKACFGLSIPVPEHIMPSLGMYLELLMQWNKAMNLVGAKTWQECLSKLLVDSFYVADFLQELNLPENPNTWDLGAGAGLPGIVLRMLWADGPYYLVEAREKRALFLQTVLTRIKLQNTHVFQGRAEDFFVKNAQSPAHIIISRAFMPWKDVLNLVQEHIALNAHVIFLALEPAPKEELKSLGWQIVAEQSYTAQGSTRTLWAVCRA